MRGKFFIVGEAGWKDEELEIDQRSCREPRQRRISCPGTHRKGLRKPGAIHGHTWERSHPRELFTGRRWQGHAKEQHRERAQSQLLSMFDGDSGEHRQMQPSSEPRPELNGLIELHESDGLSIKTP